MSRRRPDSEVAAVQSLRAAGVSDRDASELTGVPVATIRLWRRRRRTPATREREQLTPCLACRGGGHDFASLPADVYGYLLGVYLGDGHLRAFGRSWFLRLSLDCAYPGIVAQCCAAIENLTNGRTPSAKADPAGTACIRIDSCWPSWPCLLPQHGPGRKHCRRIALEPWQQALVDQAPGSFLRGLIHTDGWRGTNRVVSKGKAYEYPRYQFSNRSDDIRKLFTNTCEALGIEWRQWTRYHVSVAKRESVVLLDRFVGPKA